MVFTFNAATTTTMPPAVLTYMYYRPTGQDHNYWSWDVEMA